ANSACARFQVTPKVSHLYTVKRIFRYLKGQPKLGLWYPKDLPFSLKAYTESDYAGASLDGKSPTRGFGNYSSKEESQEVGKEKKVKNSTTQREGRNDQDEGISFVQKDAEIQGRYSHDTKINTASTSITITTVEPVTTVSTPITTAGISVSTAEPSTLSTTTTTVIKDEDLIITQTLMKMRSKGKMVKPEKPLKKKAQIELDKEIARNLEDHKLAERLQAENQRELTIEESFEEVQKAFDNTMSWINSFVSMDSEGVKDRAEGSKTRAEGSSKRAGEELESDKSKKKKLDEKVEGKISSYHIIRADGSSKRYSSMIQMLQNIYREDLETLWKLVKAKYGNTRPEEAYERVLCGDLKVMFKPNIEKKRYPLTPATITEMLNRKLQADHWNEMCYQLLKLMLKQKKKK
nr:hypothetical protein [Tanacetum cinerariifolium]